MTESTGNFGFSYLQLRSRRLEKPPLLVASSNSKKQQNPPPNEGYKENLNPNPSSRASSRLVVGSMNSGSVGFVSLGCLKDEEGFSTMGAATVVCKEGMQENNNDLGVEASFGENDVEIEGRKRWVLLVCV